MPLLPTGGKIASCWQHQRRSDWQHSAACTFQPPGAALTWAFQGRPREGKRLSNTIAARRNRVPLVRRRDHPRTRGEHGDASLPGRARRSAVPALRSGQEAPLHPIRLISFGYLHLPTCPDGSPVPPTADRIEDVHDRLRDPAAARDILDLDGVNPRAGRRPEHLRHPRAARQPRRLCRPGRRPRRIAIGCADGL